MMVNLLNRAAVEKTVLEMIYMASDNKVSQRFIRVLEVKEDGILAYCYYRKKVRTFKKNNILSVQVANRSISA